MFVVEGNDGTGAHRFAPSPFGWNYWRADSVPQDRTTTMLCGVSIFTQRYAGLIVFYPIRCPDVMGLASRLCLIEHEPPGGTF
jgi:hypothetical protein